MPPLVKGKGAYIRRQTGAILSAASVLLFATTVAIAQGPQRNPQSGPNSPSQPGQPSHPSQPSQPNSPTRPNQPPPPPPGPRFGDPLPGLTGQQLDAFAEGKDEFTDIETVQDGLGPIFNRNSCAACHAVPAIGGSSDIFVTRFGRASGQTFDPLTSLGGSLLQSMAINPIALEHVPSQANVTAHRQSTPLFGLGLVEAIPDATILRGVRTVAADGVAGRASMVVDVASGRTRVGRFGWKAQQATLLAFAGDAYLNEMGITNRLFPNENAPNGNTTLLARLDTVRDPEDVVDRSTGKAGIDRLADFMRFLGPPPSQGMNVSRTFGAKIFLDTGCASCHTPMMTTGTSTISALNSKSVWLYSDLLLHDMGTLADGIGQAPASPKEMKTAPLWGLRESGPYLHDGRAPDIDTAIKEHDGEARHSKNKYLNLEHDQKQLLIEFLNSI